MMKTEIVELTNKNGRVEKFKRVKDECDHYVYIHLGTKQAENATYWIACGYDMYGMKVLNSNEQVEIDIEKQGSANV